MTTTNVSCDLCGKIVSKQTNHVNYARRNGNPMFCSRECFGIHHSKHRDSNSATHITWMSLRGRCNNPNNPKYPRYGGRGIKVCERWVSLPNL